MTNGAESMAAKRRGRGKAGNRFVVHGGEKQRSVWIKKVSVLIKQLYMFIKQVSEPLKQVPVLIK
jgi:hypothetical protein